MEEQLGEAQRESKRQAAPFRRKNRIPKSEHKKSGRPKDHKPSNRPRPETWGDEVEAPLGCNCPDCGLDLEDIQEHESFVVDTPPVPPPTTTRVVTWSGRCPRCKVRHRSKHPDYPSNADGAAGITLGNNVVALAALMRTQLGAPLRKIALFFSLVLGFSVSAAGVLNALRRLTLALAPTYQGLIAALRTCNVLHVDETGWRICSKSAWLWVFTNEHLTVYVIRYGRGKKVLIEVLGSNYSGWLITDCLATYDSPLFPKKAKCVGHFLKSLSDLEVLHMKPKELPSEKQEKPQDGKEIPPPAPSPAEAGALHLVSAQKSTEDHGEFPRKAKSILAMAINLKHSQPQLSGEIYEGTRSVIHHLLDDLLSEEITEPNNLRLANRMRKHRKAMLAFLDHVEVEPTNNRAERQLRPGVLQRKISAGNRSEEGAQIHATLLTVFATAMQQGKSFLALAGQALRNPIEPVLALPARAP
ncbi:transposase [bacterium]|nr:transposase [bacterium]